MTAIASASVPPEWYVVATLLGLWIGFIGAPWLASRTQGTRHFFRDLGVRFRVIDLVGIAIGVGGQILVAIMYAPFQHDIHDFNGALAEADGRLARRRVRHHRHRHRALRPGHGGALLPGPAPEGRSSACSRSWGQPAAPVSPESSWP